MSEEEMKKLFENWSRNYNLHITEIEGWYYAAEKELKEKYPQLSPKELKNRVLTRVYMECQRTRESKIYEGTIYGDTGPLDWIQIRKRSGIGLFKRDPDKALRTGVVKKTGDAIMMSGRDPVIFDERKKDWDGSPNESYGKPLAGTNIQRTVYLYGDDVPVIRVSVYGEQALSLAVPQFKVARFYAKQKQKQPEGELALSLYSTLETVGEPSELQKHLEGHPWCKGFEEIPKLQETEAMIIGDVINISFLKDRNTIRLGDYRFSGHSLRINLPKLIPINFGKDSKVIVPCRINKKWVERGTVYNANGYGVYAIPTFLVPPTIESPSTLPEAKGLPAPSPSEAQTFAPVSSTEKETDKKKVLAGWILKGNKEEPEPSQ